MKGWLGSSGEDLRSFYQRNALIFKQFSGLGING